MTSVIGASSPRNLRQGGELARRPRGNCLRRGDWDSVLFPVGLSYGARSNSTAIAIFSGWGLPLNAQANSASSDAIRNDVISRRPGLYLRTPANFARTRPSVPTPKGWLSSRAPRRDTFTSRSEIVTAVAVSDPLMIVTLAALQSGQGGVKVG